MFAQPQRFRRFAVHVLLVWLFALGSAVANACMVQPGLSHGFPLAHLDAGHGHAAQPDEARSAAHDQDCEHSSRPPCERLCDGPSVVPQAEKYQSSPLDGFLLAAAPLPSFDFQSSAEPNATRSGTHHRWRTTVPIPISFLRLTL